MKCIPIQYYDMQANFHLRKTSYNTIELRGNISSIIPFDDSLTVCALKTIIKNKNKNKTYTLYNICVLCMNYNIIHLLYVFPKDHFTKF